MKILMSAYACEPHKGSEPGVGWNWVLQVARRHEVWVLTRANNQKTIEDELAKNAVERLHFVYVDLPKWLSFWKKKQRGIHIYYLLWQVASYIRAKKLLREISFDAAHHVTFGVYSFPSGVGYLGLPFVWGPVGGIDCVPRELQVGRDLCSRMKESLRILSHRLLFYGFSLGMMRRTDMVLCRTAMTHSFLSKWVTDGKTKIFLETGVHKFGGVVSVRRHSDRLRICYVGRLISSKGVELAVKAFKHISAKYPKVIFDVVGDGPQRKYLQKLARRLRVDERIVFHGEQSRAVALDVIASSDICLYPSMRDGGSWALMEAMSMGTAVVCLDHSGPGEIVKNGCGVKVVPSNKEGTVRSLAEAVIGVCADESLREKIGTAGKRHVENVYSWEMVGEKINEVYSLVLSRLS